MGGDMFVFPKLPGNASEARVKGQELLAEIMLSAEAQSGYNASKSSVPSRVDVDVTGADKCKAQALKAMADPNVPVPSENFLLLPDASGALQELQGELWAGTVTPEAFIERFATTIAQAE
jgi:glucose/mannose transport system substrate-binding protein